LLEKKRIVDCSTITLSVYRKIKKENKVGFDRWKGFHSSEMTQRGWRLKEDDSRVFDSSSFSKITP
ncbi:hypothetical protein P5673_004614, partial [Acropora cervicornis]